MGGLLERSESEAPIMQPILPSRAHDDLVELTQTWLADAGTAWSLGVSGAIAEFSLLPDDPPPHLRRTASGGSIVTSRGALVVHLPRCTRLVAYERSIDGSPSWRQEAVYYVPEDGSRPGRHVLAELGRDANAARPEDAEGLLFELGIGAPHVDFCVRTADPSLIATLRSATGQSVLSGDHPAVRAIKSVAPQRVCRSAAARIEVYQSIGSHRARRPTPAGPHTHLLPALLEGAEVKAPAGYAPALTVYPPHPLREADGGPRSFDAARHAAFQKLLERHAPAGWVEEKTMAIAAVRAGLPPERYPCPESGEGRQAVRVALRQLRWLDHDPAVLDAWLAVFEPDGSTVQPGNHP